MLAFAAASLLCALAPTITVLIVGRSVQGVAGACVIAGAIELLARSRGTHGEAAAAWGTAGLIGVAVGPAVGRPADAADQLAVDLHRAGPGRPGRGRGAPAAAGRGRAWERAAAAAGARGGAGAAVGGPDRRAVPAGGHADRGLGPVAARGRADRVGDPGRARCSLGC